MSSWISLHFIQATLTHSEKEMHILQDKRSMLEDEKIA